MIDQLKEVDFLRDDVDSVVILQVFFGATRQVVGGGSGVDAERVGQLLDVLLRGAGARPMSAPSETTMPTLTDINRKLDAVLDRLDADS